MTAAGQTPPPVAGRPAASAPSAAVPTPNSPRVGCRAAAREKGLRGQPLRDAVQLCVAERRLACVKEAIERKIVGKERREFVRACAARPGGQQSTNAGSEEDETPPEAAQTKR
jgi:hypothetical protein